LYYAARSNPNVAILEYLISKGADVNTKDRNGMTPLLLLLMKEHVRSY